MNDRELLSISDFLLVLYRRKVIFLLVWFLVMAVAVAYLFLAKKTYRLSGTIYVGRFQEILLEEGEFVAHKLEDYSFIKKALDRSGVTLDKSITRLQKDIRTDVLNEVKKISDVGLVKLTVEYEDREKAYEIFKALTDQLILEHGELLENSAKVFREMEDLFWKSEEELRRTLSQDETYTYATEEHAEKMESAPSRLLARHTVSEKQEAWRRLIKDIHYIKIEGDSATKSFNTKLSAEPQIPDEHVKPRGLLTLILGAFMATVAAVLAAMLYNLYVEELRPKLRDYNSRKGSA